MNKEESGKDKNEMNLAVDGQLENFLKRLEMAINDSCKTKSSIESEIGVSEGYLSKLSKLKKGLTLDTLCKLVICLGTDYNSLFRPIHSGKEEIEKREEEVLCEFLRGLQQKTADGKYIWKRGINIADTSCYFFICDCKEGEEERTLRLYECKFDSEADEPMTYYQLLLGDTFLYESGKNKILDEQMEALYFLVDTRTTEKGQFSKKEIEFMKKVAKED